MVPASTDQIGISSALRSVAVVGLLLTVASPLVLGFALLPSVALGAAVATFNLWAILRVVRAFLYPVGARAPWILFAMFKLVALFAGVSLLVHSGSAQVLPLLIGFAALPLGIVVSQLKSAAPAPGQG
jgi:hypothetical protein